MSYKDRLNLYEQKKKQIAATSKSSKEYEVRIKALAERLNV